MISASLFEKIAVTKLNQRCVHDPYGPVYFRMKDGKGEVRLSPAEWDAIGRHFRDAIAPAGRRLRHAMIFAIPFAIALLAVIVNIPILDAATKQFDRAIPVVLPLLVIAGLPFWGIAQHAIAVRRAFGEIEDSLALRGRCAAPPQPPRKALNLFEMLALILVGPHLLIQIYGSFNPDAFRNTPWTGTHLDMFGVAGLFVLGGLAFLRWRAGRVAAFQPPAEGEGRTVDALARARDRS